MRRLPIALLLLLTTAIATPAAEIAVLTNANWDRLVPAGKEADAILGDFALRSDRLQVVIGQPLPTRNANMTVRLVGGAVIDLTETGQPNDQLGAFYPGMRKYDFSRAEVVQAKGATVRLVCTAPARPAEEKKGGKPAAAELRVEYTLTDGKPFLLVRSTFKNTFDNPLEIDLEDDLRADNFDAKSKPGDADLFYVHDRYFGQAYAVLAEGRTIRSRSDIRNSTLQYVDAVSKSNRVTLAPGKSLELVRRLFVGPHLLAVKGEAEAFAGRPTVTYGWHLVDPLFRPVRGAELTVKQGDTEIGSARSDSWGWVKAALPPGKYEVEIKSVGRGTRTVSLDLTGKPAKSVINIEHALDEASQVEAVVTDEKGGPIPCKVAFNGLEPTASPNWGPPSARDAVVNLYYSANGKFTVPINPGKYEAVVSYGPAFEVVRVPLEVGKGQTVPLRASVRRAFATPGWVSTDYHSHASPSGDNTSDQRGRVLNLLAENIEYAPCTEHNRLESYVPHLKALGAERFMGTCVGMELTGTPLPLNHQNAFPLKWKPRTQDGGAPVTDVSPEVQIRRLLGWDDGAEKLVQQNHPDIGWLFYDRDGDGKPDGGYKDGFAAMHVIEVHPIDDILALEASRTSTNTRGQRIANNNTIFNWLQLLNQGHRIPGVVNTDAHYNFHGSGGLRNYVRCDAGSLDAIDPLEIVRHSKKGHLVMSNGPFLDVKLNNAIPGDDLSLPEGKGTLQVRVLCPSWFDVDRLQVLVNGRPDPALNFTRKSHPQLFRDGPVRLEYQVPVALKGDAHLIVVAVGEESQLGPVMGPFWGRQRPTAVSNPIFVDVDGGGFKANGDTLGAPLPTKGGVPAK